MTKRQVKEVLDRVLSWPEERQAEIFRAVEVACVVVDVLVEGGMMDGVVVLPA